MRYLEDFDRSRQISGSALEIMAEHRIPVTPANYEVWYAYASGSAPELKEKLDALLASNEVFTAERNDQIYRDFLGCAGEAEAIESVGSEVQRCAEEIIQELSRARTDQGDFGAKVGSLSSALSGAQDPGEIGRVVRDILFETQSILSKSRELEEKLFESTKEIEDLRSDLKHVREEALTDALTGIANRKCFDQRLRQAATEALKNGTPLSLMILDIDHFKKFNDTYGHAVGDSVLRVVAGQLKQSLKGQDLPARYGGEEFSILLPKTALADATKFADKLRIEIGARQLKDSKSDMSYGSITLSVGVAQFRTGEDLEAFVDRADQALYGAKRNGRNRVMQEIVRRSALSAAG